MPIGHTMIDGVTLEGIVAEWFRQRGMKIISVEINLVGSDGDWEIGQATRRAGADFHGLARQAEAELRRKFKLITAMLQRLCSRHIERASSAEALNHEHTEVRSNLDGTMFWTTGKDHHYTAEKVSRFIHDKPPGRGN